MQTRNIAYNIPSLQEALSMIDVFGENLSRCIATTNITSITYDNYILELRAEGRKSRINGIIKISGQKEFSTTYKVTYCINPKNDNLPLDTRTRLFENKNNAANYARKILFSTFPVFMEGVGYETFASECFEHYKRHKSPTDKSIIKEIEYSFDLASLIKQQTKNPSHG